MTKLDEKTNAEIIATARMLCEQRGTATVNDIRRELLGYERHNQYNVEYQKKNRETLTGWRIGSALRTSKEFVNYGRRSKGAIWALAESAIPEEIPPDPQSEFTDQEILEAAKAGAMKSKGGSIDLKGVYIELLDCNTNSNRYKNRFSMVSRQRVINLMLTHGFKSVELSSIHKQYVYVGEV